MDEERKYITRTNSVNWPTSVQKPVVLIIGRRRAPELSKKRDASDWWNEELTESLSTRYSFRMQTQTAGAKTSLPVTACPPSPTSLNHPRIVTAPQLTPCRLLPPGIASHHFSIPRHGYRCSCFEVTATPTTPPGLTACFVPFILL